jgi:hypothetical protein
MIWTLGPNRPSRLLSTSHQVFRTGSHCETIASLDPLVGKPQRFRLNRCCNLLPTENMSIPKKETKSVPEGNRYSRERTNIHTETSGSQSRTPRRKICAGSASGNNTLYFGTAKSLLSSSKLSEPLTNFASGGFPSDENSSTCSNWRMRFP